MPRIIGTSAAERLQGGLENDVLIGLAGADTLEGGAGVDTVDYEGSSTGVNVNLVTGVANDGLGSNDVLVSIEDVGGSDFNDIIIGSDVNNYIDGRGNNDSIVGGAGDDLLIGGWGDDTLIGGDGNDYLRGESGFDKLDGGAGFDTASFEDFTAGVAIDIYQGTWDDSFLNIENVFGSAFNDTIKGDYQDNILRGFAGDDVIEGREGSDQIEGGAGNDTIDGGDGTDTILYAGARASYQVQAGGNGWIVTDTRAGGEGVDTLRNVEILKFSDITLNLAATGPVNATVAAAVSNILRVDGQSSPLSADLSSKIAAGSMSVSAAIGEVVKAADASSSVATLSYQFFTGKIPGLGGMDYLVSPTGPNGANLNSAYYQSFNLENRYINFAVNLGKEGEGKAAFQAEYGSLSLFQATKLAYGEIFGGTPTDAKVEALLSGGRGAYFEAYGQDGPNGQGTKAAMVGWLLSEAVKADIGMYARANDAFLVDLADGANFAVDLVGVYGKPEFNFSGGV